MKNFLILIIALVLVGGTLHAQNCKVLLNTINQSYEGDCKKGKADGKGFAKGTDTYAGEFKKGLPHGKGIYTWANKNVYDGDWENGQKDGSGRLIIKTLNEKDSILTGFWKKDEYIGLYKSPYKKIDKSQDVSALSIDEVKDKSKISSIRFFIKEDMKQVYSPQMNFSLHNGKYSDIKYYDRYVELYDVIFPIKLKAYYKQDYIEIEIFKPGLWDVITEITRIKGLN